MNERPDFSHFESYKKPSEVGYRIAYGSVLESAGAFPRDIITKTTIEDVKQRTGKWGARIPSNLMSGLKPSDILLDSDNDGLPNDWELNNGLKPENPKDQHAIMMSGYGAIEEYINELADELIK